MDMDVCFSDNKFIAPHIFNSARAINVMVDLSTRIASNTKNRVQRIKKRLHSDVGWEYSMQNKRLFRHLIILLEKFFDLSRELKRKLFSRKKECVMTDSICNENARKCRTIWNFLLSGPLFELHPHVHFVLSKD